VNAALSDRLYASPLCIRPRFDAFAVPQYVAARANHAYTDISHPFVMRGNLGTGTVSVDANQGYSLTYSDELVGYVLLYAFLNCG
jgi:hypothetical protein